MSKLILFFGVVLSISLSSCSNKKSQSKEDAQLDAMKTSSGLSTASSAEGGVLNFFVASVPERGLVIRSINWTAPLSSENPGADCELKRRQSTDRLNVFTCIAKEGAETTILNIHEEVVGASAHIKRITMDAKGEKIRDRWMRTLNEMAYKKVVAIKGTPAGRVSFLSADKKTKAQIVWAAAAQAATIILSPGPASVQK